MPRRPTLESQWGESFRPLLAYLYLPVDTTPNGAAQLKDLIDEFREHEGYSTVLLFVAIENGNEILTLVSLMDHIELLGRPDVLVAGPSAMAFEVLSVFEELDGIRVRTLGDVSRAEADSG